jgi:phosphoribosylformylglycinamidine synthase
LTDNALARFMDRWVGFEVEKACSCVWTKGLEEGLEGEVRAEVMVLPIAHGEGRLVASPEVLASLEREGRVALRYRDDVNGSAGRIAGLCDASGLVFGLMPHPERFLEWNRHPAWTRLPEGVRKGVTPGLKMFVNAVAAVR